MYAETAGSSGTLLSFLKHRSRLCTIWDCLLLVACGAHSHECREREQAATCRAIGRLKRPTRLDLVDENAPVEGLARGLKAKDRLRQHRLPLRRVAALRNPPALNPIPVLIRPRKVLQSCLRPGQRSSRQLMKHRLEPASTDEAALSQVLLVKHLSTLPAPLQSFA